MHDHGGRAVSRSARGGPRRMVADVRHAIGFSSFAVLIYYLVADTAALRLGRGRRRLPAWVPVLGLIGCVVMAGSLPWQSVVGGVVVLLIGGLVYAVPRARTPG